MTRWTHGLVNRLVLLCDIVMAALAAIIAHGRWDFLSWSQIAILWAIGVFAYVQILQAGRAYRVEHYDRPLRQLGHLAVAGVPADVYQPLPTGVGGTPGTASVTMYGMWQLQSVML